MEVVGKRKSKEEGRLVNKVVRRVEENFSKWCKTRMRWIDFEINIALNRFKTINKVFMFLNKPNL